MIVALTPGGTCWQRNEKKNVSIKFSDQWFNGSGQIDFHTDTINQSITVII